MEFKEYKLDELYVMDSGISTKKEQAGHGSPFISFKDIFNNAILPDVLTEKMDTTELEQEKYSVKKGDILLTRTSETLDELAMSSVAIKDYPQATFSGFAKRLRPINTNITYDKFMAFFLRSEYFRRIVNCKAVMTLRASFNEEIFSYIKILLPDYEYQKKCGDLFYEIECQIRDNNKINIELEKIAKTIYDYWFLQFEFPNEDGKPYKSSGGKMVWNEELKQEIPEGWTVGALGEFFESQSGYAFDSNEWKIKGIPVLTIKSILEDGSVDIKSASYIDNQYTDKMNKYSVLNGNMIFAMSGNTIGKIGIIASKEKEILINQRVLIIKTDINNIAYTYFNIKNQDIQNKILQLGSNSVQPNISEQSLKKIKVCKPNSKILNRYNKVCSIFFDEIISNRVENERLDELKNFLLPLLMNGQVGLKKMDK